MESHTSQNIWATYVGLMGNNNNNKDTKLGGLGNGG